MKNLLLILILMIPGICLAGPPIPQPKDFTIITMRLDVINIPEKLDDWGRDGKAFYYKNTVNFGGDGWLRFTVQGTLDRVPWLSPATVAKILEDQVNNEGMIRATSARRLESGDIRLF